MIHLFDMFKSTRSLAVVIFAIGLTVGLFMGKIPNEMYTQASMLVLGAYFARRDSKEERS